MLHRTMFLKIIAGLLLLTSLGFYGCESSGTGADSDDTYPEYPEGIVYVLNQTDSTVYVFDAANLTSRIDSFNAKIEQPHWIEFSPDGQFFYLNGRFPPAQVARFRASTNTFVDAVTVEGNIVPTAMVINATNDIGYICNFTTSFVLSHIHKYNLTNMTLIDSLISNGAASHDLKITSDKSIIVTCSRNSDDVTLVYLPQDTARIFPLDPNNIRPTPYVHGPYGVAIDHRDSLAYIACLKSGQVRVFDIAARAVVDSIIIPITPHPLYTPSGPTLMAVSPDNQKLFVTTQWGNTLVVADVITGAMTIIPLSAERPFGIKMNADGSRVYVACVNIQDQPGRIYVIDGVTLAKLDSVDVGKNSYALEWRP